MWREPDQPGCEPPPPQKKSVQFSESENSSLREEQKELNGDGLGQVTSTEAVKPHCPISATQKNYRPSFRAQLLQQNANKRMFERLVSILTNLFIMIN